MSRFWLKLSAAPAVLAAVSCTVHDGSANDAANKPADKTPATTAAGPGAPAAQPANARDTLASNDKGPAGPAEDKPRPLMQLQVVLDRLGFSPGVVDGKEGMSTRNGLTGFQEANGLKSTGQYDDATKAKLAEFATIPATRLVTIPADFAAGPFVAIPKTPEEKAKLPSMSYETLIEKLAERFHTTEDVLRELNPTVQQLGAGTAIRVPNVGNDTIVEGSVENRTRDGTLRMLGIGTQQPRVEKVMVDKSDSMLRAYDKDGKVVAAFTATMGSARNPLPIGEWTIKGVAFNPNYSFDPSVLSTVRKDQAKAVFPPGPNSPVGVVWIDLSKDHYGIHGTPKPETIGRAQSDGCVRLTNWDAARLALMVHPGIKAVFKQ